MNSAMRWRIMTLQAVLVVLLGAGAIFAYGLGTFTTNQIKDELTAQQIYFPAKDQIKSGGALDPAEFPAEIRDQAGNQVTDGNQARIYANDYIGKHLEATAKGETYASLGPKISALKAQQAALAKDDPAYADLGNQITTLTATRETLFKGETLRSSLLNAYGWWTIGTYTTYAAYGLMLMTLVMIGAFAFEFVVARRPEEVKVTQRGKAISTTA